MNISKNVMSGKCDEKCSYSFNYRTSSNCNATNYGSYINFTYDKSTSPSIKFNNLDYDVDKIEIYSPSVHLFTNNNVDGEIIITHSSLSSGSPLLVCIPISSSSPVSDASKLLTSLVSAVVSTPLYVNNPQISIKVDNYNLNSIVPKKPYFFYTSANNDINVIVYGIDYSINLDKELITNLRTLITPPENTAVPNSDTLYYNKKGPSSSTNGDDQIYIDCKPTGNSDDTVDITNTKKKTPISYDLESLKSNKLLMYIIYSVVFVIIIMLIHKLLVYIFN